MKKISKFVIDTNTLVSAFLLSSTSTAAKAYYKTERKIVHSEETFNEFSDVFIRPKFDRYLSLTKRLAIIEDLRTLAEIIPVTTVLTVCRDPKDNKFLELAVESGASCIITGDKDLLVLNPFEGVPIMTAADFLNTFKS
jgi:putative PIN family toxin of toxin-antitoxin system